MLAIGSTVSVGVIELSGEAEGVIDGVGVVELLFLLQPPKIKANPKQTAAYRRIVFFIIDSSCQYSRRFFPIYTCWEGKTTGTESGRRCC